MMATNSRIPWLLASALFLAGAALCWPEGSVKINLPLTPHQTIEEFWVSPDQKRVVIPTQIHFDELEGTDAQFDLWTANLDDNSTTRIISRFDGEFGAVCFIPDGARMICQVHKASKWQEPYAFVVPITGGTPLFLGQGLTGNDVGSFQLTPDGERVIIRSDNAGSGAFELYSQPITGDPVVKLNNALSAGAYVQTYQISPDGSRVVFSVNPGAQYATEIYSAPVSGGPATKLTPPFTSGGKLAEFSITPDSAQVVYLADQDIYWVPELYRVPIGGGTVVQLNRPIPFGEDPSHGVFFYEVNPAGGQAAYCGMQDTPGVIELYSVSLSGGAPVKLNPPLVQDGDVKNGFFKYTPDGSHILYNADQEQDNKEEIYSVSSSGGPVVKVSDPSITCYGGAGVSPDSRWVLWFSTSYWAYRSPISGGSVLNMAEDVTYTDCSFTSDSVFLNYRDGNRTKIYRVPLAAGTPAVELTDSSDGHSFIRDYWVSPDGTRILYAADSPPNNRQQLYSRRVPLPPELEGSADAGAGSLRATWSDDRPTSPAQYLGFAYDVYDEQFVPRGWEGTIWFPFPSAARSGLLGLAQTGAYHAWISSQEADGVWQPCLDPASTILYSGQPHAPRNVSVESLGSNQYRLHWKPEIYGTWLYQILVYQDGPGWITPLDGPCHAYPQFGPWTFLDYGGTAYDGAKASFFDGWADFTLPPGGPYTFFLNFLAWDAATQGPFAAAASP